MHTFVMLDEDTQEHLGMLSIEYRWDESHYEFLGDRLMQDRRTKNLAKIVTSVTVDETHIRIGATHRVFRLSSPERLRVLTRIAFDKECLPVLAEMTKVASYEHRVLTFQDDVFEDADDPFETLTAFAHDIVKHIVDFDDQMQTILFEVGYTDVGFFKGAFLRPGVFACDPVDEEWFDKHILLDDEYDEEMLEDQHVACEDFDWSTIFRSKDGRIFVFGTCETEGFNEWNPSFSLHCIGRLFRREMSVAPFSSTLGKSFACSRRNKHTFHVELHEGVFICHKSQTCKMRTRFAPRYTQQL